MIDFEAARVRMVESQIRTNDVTSYSVLNAFLAVPREAFVPENDRLLAYRDANIQITNAAPGQPNRFMMEPATLARLMQLAAIKKTDDILEVGTGTGYGTALLSLVANSVTSVEVDPALADKASAALQTLGYSNAKVVAGPLEAGHPAAGHYSLIFINGSVEEVPNALFDQLREGGRLVTVQGAGNAARAKMFMREKGGISEATLFSASARPLPGFQKPREFVF